MTRCNITAARPASQFVRSTACAWALAAGWLLSACGGGGGGGTPTPIPAPPDPAPVIAGCSLLYPLANPARTGTTDPLVNGQWHLQPANVAAGTQGLGATLAWERAQGRGVRVAIIDGPVETSNADLSPNALAGQSFDYRLNSATEPLPCNADSTGSHGTAVAGILAAARSNGFAGAGVAPLASIVAYNAIESGIRAEIARQRIAHALDRNPLNAIYNLSWGSDDDGALHPADTAIAAAIERGVQSGRGGLGALYVFASGNGGCLGGGIDQTVVPPRCLYRDMTGFDGHLNLPGTITACAVDREGKLPLWAEEGENLLVCGLSSNSAGNQGITTLAPGNTTRNDFGGASAAAPMVSGVIALMLEVQPQLSWREVRTILAETARENRPDDPSWSVTELQKWPPQLLAGQPVRKRFSRRFGFGVVDAAAAVERAAAFTPSGAPGAALKACEKSAQPAITLSDPVASELFWASNRLDVDANDLTAGGCPSVVEWIEVFFSATHPYAADLQIELVSPSGQVSRLADSRVCGGVGKISSTSGEDRCGSYAGWRFLANRHLGEASLGGWTLRVADAGAGDIGTWDRWTLRLAGR